jgi:large subunit ribosomal protein L35
MPKMKSRSSAKKRFSLTAKGHLKRKKAFRSHILTKKATKRKRTLRAGAIVSKTQEKKLRNMISH